MSSNNTLITCSDCGIDLPPTQVINYGDGIQCYKCGGAKKPKKKYYRMLICETVSHTVFVEAWNEQQAKAMAEWQPPKRVHLENKTRDDVLTFDVERISRQDYKERKRW